MDNEVGKEFLWGKPCERSHRSVVRTSIVDSELVGKIMKGEKAVGGIEAPLILTMTSFHLAIVSWGVRTDELVADAQLRGGGFKQGGQVALGIGEAICEFKPVICLDTFHSDAAAFEPGICLLKEVGGGISGLLLIGSKKAQARELVDGGVLEQVQFWVCDAGSGYDLNVYLYPLTRIGHLLVGLWLVGFHVRRGGGQPQPAQDAEQALRAAGITPLPQPVPQLWQAQVRVPAPHVPDELQLLRCMFIGVMMRAA